MLWYHIEGARTRDRHCEPCTTQRGGDDLEDLSQAFGERAERDQAHQGPDGEVSDRAFLTRLDAQESFFGSVGESVNIHSAEENKIGHVAKLDDRPEERTMVAGSLTSRKMPAEKDNDARVSGGMPTKPSGPRMPRPSQ
jgi:hypothetical protein